MHELADVGAAGLWDRAEDERGGGVGRDDDWIERTGRRGDCAGPSGVTGDKIRHVEVCPRGSVGVEKSGASRGNAAREGERILRKLSAERCCIAGCTVDRCTLRICFTDRSSTIVADQAGLFWSVRAECRRCEGTCEQLRV